MGTDRATRTPRALLVICVVVGGLVAPARASADDVVARLPRDTPIAAYGGVVAWSDHDAATGRYRLVIRRGDQASAAPVPAARRPFDVSVGPDARGRIVALYTRCRTATHGCDVYRYDIRAGRERRVESVSSPAADEAWPVQWRDRLAFVRRARAYGVRDRRSDTLLRPDPRGKRGGGKLVRCDAPYVKTLSARSRPRPLDRGLCSPTTGLSIRGERIVQVTDFYEDFNAAETQVRLLNSRGGRARVLARGPSGLGGYSPFASPTQSASAVWLTRTGNREPMDFLRIELASGRMTAVHPNVPLAGRVARDDRGTFWYVQAPAPWKEDFWDPPFCMDAVEPCRLVRASASPFTSATRKLAPRMRFSAGEDIRVPFTDPLVLSGDLTRAVVRRSSIVGREPVRAASLELLRSPGTDDPASLEPGRFFPTGLRTKTDAAGRWSFALSPPPSSGYFAAGALGTGIASGSVRVTVSARLTLTASGRSLTGMVTPAQPGRSVKIQRLEADGEGKLPDGAPRCVTLSTGERECRDEAWITVSSAPLDADGSAFSAAVGGPGFYRAELPEDERAFTPQANPGIYGGRSPEVRIDG